MIEDEKIKELLKLKDDGYLYHRESQNLEFKEQFNLAGLADYFRDFAAFANNKGGYLIFGVSNSPRTLVGLKKKSIEQFEKIDPEKISGYLLEIFSGDIQWEQTLLEEGTKKFGVFYIYPAKEKPVIAKKDEGKDQIIKNGEIYYRYGGRTQKIQYAELHSIIHNRLNAQNQQWQSLMAKIGKIGPPNAAILDTEKGIIEKDDSQVLVIDEDLLRKISFIKEGEFSQKEGKTTLKVVGDVQPIDSVEIVKVKKQNLIEDYPFSAMELADEIKRRKKELGRDRIWAGIKEHDLKNNKDYSAYNFRNKKQEDKYKETGEVPSGAPSIYNQNAVDFLINVLSNDND